MGCVIIRESFIQLISPCCLLLTSYSTHALAVFPLFSCYFGVVVLIKTSSTVNDSSLSLRGSFLFLTLDDSSLAQSWVFIFLPMADSSFRNTSLAWTALWAWILAMTWRLCLRSRSFTFLTYILRMSPWVSLDFWAATNCKSASFSKGDTAAS